MKNKRRRKFAIMNSALFVYFIAVMGTILVIYDKPDYSELERRDLAKWPEFTKESYFDGSYTRNISAYIADVFPFRENLINLASDVKELNGFRFDDIKIHNVNMQEAQSQSEPAKEEISASESVSEAVDSSSISESTSAKEEISASESTAPSESENVKPEPKPVEEQATANNGIYVYKGKAFAMFGASRSMGDYYASAVNYYHQVFGDSVKIYNLIVPSAIEYGMPEKYKKMSQPQKPAIEYVYSNLDPAVTPVRIYDTLMDHKDEYLYFGTDHHWTALGAYYAYTEFAKSAGLTPVDINTLPKKTLNNFIGTLYNQTNDSSLLEHPDHVDYYEMTYPVTCYRIQKDQPYTYYEEPLYGEYALPGNSYSVFLHGDFPLTKIVTGNKNGKKIAVIKESYGNAFSPFLINNYEEIYVVDERHFQTDLIGLVRDNGIQEILIINNVAAAHTGFHIDNIIRILDQQYIPPAPVPEVPAPQSEPVPEETYNDEDDDD